ncbi:tail fiber domain-containing protein, partial [Flavobacterium sp. ZS1P14]|uniref:tail fiber domain-containing protein n=1 Tax=Flavobacterium sp. ZS1P14 TaxID=3401729 RepID=UPI003AAB3695
VGNSSNKAASVPKSAILLSDLGAATANIDLGTKKIVNLADPTAAQEAATKYYVDTRTATPANMDLTQDYVLVGNSSNKAASVPKSAILLSDLGAATANIDLGTKKIVNLADPTTAQEAATKYYVDTRTATPANMDLTQDYVLVGNSSNKAAAVPKSAILLSDLGTATADIDLGTKKIVNLAEPTMAKDAATKNYVDSHSSSMLSAASAPGSAVAGDMYYNTGDSHLYVYNGTGWVPMDNKLASGELYTGDASGVAVSTAKNTIALSGFAAALVNIDLGSQKIVNLAEPTMAADAATKNYVDARTATPGNLDLTQDYVLVGNSSNKAASVPKSVILLSDLGAAAADIDLGTKKILNLSEPTISTDAATKYYVDTRTATPANMDLTQDYVLVGNSSNKAAAVPKSAILLSDLGAPTADIDLGTKKIVNLAEPTMAKDAATKNYVDSHSSSMLSAASAPGSAVAGDMYYNTGDSHLYVYNGTGWLPMDNKLASGELYTGDASGVAVSTAKNTIALSGFAAALVNIDLGSQKIVNLAEPTMAADAATKNYVDARTATPGNLDLTQDYVLVGNSSNKAAAVPKSAILLSDLGAPTADIDLGTKKIVNLAEPTMAKDAATKNYVDSHSSSMLSAASAPGSAVAGDMYYNTGDSHLYVYNGTGWLPMDNKLASGELYTGDASGVAVSTAKSTIVLSGFAAAATNIDLGSQKIVNLAEPTMAADAATKNYVDTKVSSIASGADNLGNHTATQNIKLSVNSINNDGQNGKGLSFATRGDASFGQDVTVNGNFYTPSDSRLKTHIETLDNVLQKIEQIRGIRFEYRDQHKYATGSKVGVIAQELQRVYPEMVTQGKDGFLKVDYTQLTGIVIQAIKEQQKEIDALKAQMDHQQQQIERILKKMN